MAFLKAAVRLGAGHGYWDFATVRNLVTGGQILPQVFPGRLRVCPAQTAAAIRGLRGGEEPAAATPRLGQARSGVHPLRKFVAPDPSPEYDGLKDSKSWSRKAPIWE